MASTGMHCCCGLLPVSNTDFYASPHHDIVAAMSVGTLATHNLANVCAFAAALYSFASCIHSMNFMFCKCA